MQKLKKFAKNSIFCQLYVSDGSWFLTVNTVVPGVGKSSVQPQGKWNIFGKCLPGVWKISEQILGMWKILEQKFQSYERERNWNGTSSSFRYGERERN